MPQSTFRRYNVAMALAVSVVFSCTIAYMANIHVQICEYEHLQELTYRALTVSSLLSVSPFVDSLEAVASALQASGSTSSALAYTMTTATNVMPTGSSSFPYSVSVGVPSISGVVITITEGDMIPKPLSCRPLVVGQGLCLLLCFLCIQLALSQAGNLLAQQGRRWLGIGLCWSAHIIGIAFIVGTVVLMATTQRQCAMYNRAEDMKISAMFVNDVVAAMIQDDDQAVTKEKLSAALGVVESMMEPGRMLRFANVSFPSSLPYYAQLGGSLLLTQDYVAFNVDSHLVAATSIFMDSLDATLYYISDRYYSSSNVLDDPHASRGITLGIVPYVIVALVAILLLPYPTLGALESGEDGVFPSEWKMSVFSGEVKFLHLGLVVVVVISMCTISLSACYGNRLVFEQLMGDLSSFSSASQTASDVAEQFLNVLRSITQRTFTLSTRLTLPASTYTDDEYTQLFSFYVDIVSRQGTIIYNSSSVANVLRQSVSAPLLMNQTGFQSIVARADTNSAMLLEIYAMFLDMRFYTFAQTANATWFKEKVNNALGYMTPIVTALGYRNAFSIEWNTYLSKVQPYITIGTNYAAQPYSTKDIKALYATPSGIAASAIEDTVIDRVLKSHYKPPPNQMMSAQNAQYQVQAALAVTLPVIILLTFAALWDALYTHLFFALNHKWIPANDPTAVSNKIRPDHARLWRNVRTIVGACLLTCVSLVILASIVSAQAGVDAKLRYDEQQSGNNVAADKKQLLTALSQLMATSFHWIRGTLSRSTSDLTKAVAGTLSWGDYLTDLYSLWPGTVSSDQRDAMIAAIKSMSAVIRDSVLVCGLRVISLVFAYDQLSELMTRVFASDTASAGRIVSCFSLTQAHQYASAQRGIAHTIIYSEGLEQINAYARQLAIIAAQNTTCPDMVAYINDVVFFAPVAYGLMLRDDRVAVPIIGGQLQSNATATRQAADAFLAYAPVTPQMSSHFAVFWVPVLIGWATLVLVHLAYSRMSGTVRAVNFVG